ncbi:hypothetical protein M8C21_026694 [Ambrosia artemisiifolia]|uniref:Uncharacterized protein n=1 Tax=Ambrosia artemisiifolia TaxID=4212 RepID=A0AAD5GJ45_AMBAR|nr:hypothetical protein M8C21_026694 [Ambrosia artemisiifolia]
MKNKKHKENGQLEMLEGAKLIGAGTASIVSAGATIGIGNVLNSSIHFVAQNASFAKQSFGCHFGLCSYQTYCSVCPHYELFDLIRIPIKESKKEG